MKIVKLQEIEKTLLDPALMAETLSLTINAADSGTREEHRLFWFNLGWRKAVLTFVRAIENAEDEPDMKKVLEGLRTK